VLELTVYLLLAQKLMQDGPQYSGAWNFGPGDEDARPVEWLVKQLCSQWGDTASFVVDTREHPHEAHFLKLDCSKAKTELGWKPRWSLDKAIESIVAWTKDYQKSREGKNTCLRQIEEYSALMDMG
jgi:CDP-glucose 4,6-dehydratase